MSSVQLDEGKPFWQNPALLAWVVPVILGSLRIFGVVGEDQVDTVNQLIQSVLDSAVLFGTAAVALWQWFKQETAVKVEKLALHREELKLEREQLQVEQIRMKMQMKA